MSNMQAMLSCNTKHLLWTELMSVAGSLGYVTPEVLNQKGHRKPCQSLVYWVLLIPSIHDAMECSLLFAGPLLDAPLWIHTYQVRWHEGSHTINDWTEDQLSWQILKEHIRWRYGWCYKQSPLPSCEHLSVSLTLGSGTAQQKTSFLRC
jgi:hypothetical protein